MERLLERPSRAELLDRLSVPARPPLTPSAAELVRAERDARLAGAKGQGAGVTVVV